MRLFKTKIKPRKEKRYRMKERDRERGGREKVGLAGDGVVNFFYNKLLPLRRLVDGIFFCRGGKLHFFLFLLLFLSLSFFHLSHSNSCSIFVFCSILPSPTPSHFFFFLLAVFALPISHLSHSIFSCHLSLMFFLHISRSHLLLLKF